MRRQTCSLSKCGACSYTRSRPRRTGWSSDRNRWRPAGPTAPVIRPRLHLPPPPPPPPPPPAPRLTPVAPLGGPRRAGPTRIRSGGGGGGGAARRRYSVFSASGRTGRRLLRSRSHPPGASRGRCGSARLRPACQSAAGPPVHVYVIAMCVNTKYPCVPEVLLGCLLRSRSRDLQGGAVKSGIISIHRT